jgi:RNA polymerase sigma factor (sigma-70 family)
MQPRLLGLVRERLVHSPLRDRIDPEDLVQSVLGTFWKRYRRGEWSPSGFREWDDLWNLLAKIARHRMTRRTRAALAEKRGGGAEPIPLVSADGSRVEQLGDDPDPLDLLICAETLEVLLSQLEESCQTSVLLTLEGYSTLETAESLHVTRRTVLRRLEKAREILRSLVGPEGDD